MGSLEAFDKSQITSIIATGAASKIPFVGKWADTVGGMAGRAADLSAAAEGAC